MSLSDYGWAVKWGDMRWVGGREKECLKARQREESRVCVSHQLEQYYTRASQRRLATPPSHWRDGNLQRVLGGGGGTSPPTTQFIYLPLPPIIRPRTHAFTIWRPGEVRYFYSTIHGRYHRCCQIIKDDTPCSQQLRCTGWQNVRKPRRMFDRAN